MNCIKRCLGTVSTIKFLLWQKIFDIQCIKYDVIINDWHQSLYYVIHVIHVTLIKPIVMIHKSIQQV